MVAIPLMSSMSSTQLDNSGTVLATKYSNKTFESKPFNKVIFNELKGKNEFFIKNVNKYGTSKEASDSGASLSNEKVTDDSDSFQTNFSSGCASSLQATSSFTSLSSLTNETLNRRFKKNVNEVNDLNNNIKPLQYNPLNKSQVSVIEFSESDTFCQHSKSTSQISVLNILESDTFGQHSKSSSSIMGLKQITLMSSSNSMTSTINNCKNKISSISYKHLPNPILEESSRSTSLPPAPRKPPRKYHYTDVRQMTTPASVMASTSGSNLPLRQTNQQPIRIPQPIQSHYASFKPNVIHSYQNSASSMPIQTSTANFTTTFHANPANGLTTILPSQSVLQQQQQQRNLTQALKVNLANKVVQSAESSTSSTLLVNNSAAFKPVGFAHYNSVPTLPIQQQRLASQQQRPSTSSLNLNQHKSNSLLRQKNVPTTQLSSDLSNLRQQNLFELACNQQRQIDANKSELEERRRLISATIVTGAVSKKNNESNAGRSLIDQVRIVKTQIEQDEKELTHLGSIQREARQLSIHNQMQRQELCTLEATYEQDDTQLRLAVDKVESLRKQLDLLYKRRASAASAAIAQQRKVNNELIGNNNDANTLNSLNSKPFQQQTIKIKQSPITKMTAQHRPQASVIPFQLNYSNSIASLQLHKNEIDKPYLVQSQDEIDSTVFRPEIASNFGDKKARAPPPPFRNDCKNLKNVPNQQYDESQRFLARGKPDQVSLRADSLTAVKRRSWAQAQEDSATDNVWRYLVEEQRKGRTHVSFADIMAARKANLNGDHLSMASNENIVNYKNCPIINQPQYLSHQVKPFSNNSLKNQIKPINDDLDELPSIAYTPITVSTSITASNCSPIKELTQNKQNDSPVVVLKTTVLQKSSVSSTVDNKLKANEKPESIKQVTLSIQDHKKADLPSLFSPPQNNNGNADEVEILRNESSGSDTSNTTTVDVDDNESHVSSDCNFTENCNTKVAVVDERKSSHDSSSEATLCDDNGSNEGAKTSEIVISNDNQVDYQDDDDEGFDAMEEPPEFLVNGMEEASSTTTDEASSTISACDEPMFDEQSLQCTDKAIKGIIRPPVVTHHQRRVFFDQTVLFLDVAYEGEYDFLVELAAKIPDISVANGEGITALHNAICAGNYEIVKFLIENNADVNALDLDGWSPLHCAASCNNLIMLKQLIENGACVFATTLSKSETAADLFDETHELFEPGANYIELVENCLGVINEGKVYAAFSYDAIHDDELSFEEGDELRVIDCYEKSKIDENSDKNASNNNEENCKASWWLCEHISSDRAGQQGLVPRNYLGLFPIRRYRETHNFQPFELPSNMSSGAAQRRRRMLQQAKHEQESQYAFLQWSNVSTAAAAAAEIAKVSNKPPATLNLQ